MNEHDRAVADFDSALKVDPKLASAMYLRGIAKLNLGDLAGGKADIASAQELQADIAKEYAPYGIEQPAITASQGRVTAPAVDVRTRTEALTGSPRLAFENPYIRGSISLRGGRFDDLVLNKPERILLNPSGAPGAFYVEFGWLDGTGARLAGPETMWSTEASAPLGTVHPVTLTFDSGKGLTIRRHIFVDDRYMFSVGDEIVNQSVEAFVLTPYGAITRSTLSPDERSNSGFSAALGGHGMQTITYERIIKEKNAEFDGAASWIGMTSRDLVVQLWPEPAAHAHVRFSSADDGASVQADYLLDRVTVKPGETKMISLHVYAGPAQAALAYHKMLKQ
jgi:YidC/Oxa1 family membrane protein insertase